MSEEKIEQIKKKYLEGYKYDEIILEFNITKNQLIHLIQKNKWKRKSNRSKIMKKNKNAKGNKGGHAPKENKNAVTTGEYETIYDDLLTDEEKKILEKLKLEDKKQHIFSEIKILTIRERRILKRIENLQNGKEMSVVRISKSTSSNMTYHSNGTITTTEAENNINIMQKLEDALTRIQEAKRKWLDSLHRMENDDRKLELDLIRLEIEAARDDSTSQEDLKDDSFIKALNEVTESIWDDYTEE